MPADGGAVSHITYSYSLNSPGPFPNVSLASAVMVFVPGARVTFTVKVPFTPALTTPAETSFTYTVTVAFASALPLTLKAVVPTINGICDSSGASGASLSNVTTTCSEYPRFPSLSAALIWNVCCPFRLPDDHWYDVSVVALIHAPPSMLSWLLAAATPDTVSVTTQLIVCVPLSRLFATGLILLITGEVLSIWITVDVAYVLSSSSYDLATTVHVPSAMPSVFHDTSNPDATSVAIRYVPFFSYSNIIFSISPATLTALIVPIRLSIDCRDRLNVPALLSISILPLVALPSSTPPVP